jgi:hypothetical protein
VSKRMIILAALGAPAVLAGTLLGTGAAHASTPPPSVSIRATGVTATKATQIITTGPGISLKPASVYNSLPTQESDNWSGYVAPGFAGDYNGTDTDFTVPTVTCGESVTAVAFWTGLDGDTGSTVEQDGIGAYCPGGDAPAEYTAWIENYPEPEEVLTNSDGTAVPVKAGDQIALLAGEISPADYEYTIIDQAEGWSLDQADLPMPAGYTGEDASAEVIAEAPSSASGVYTLAKFSPVSYTSSLFFDTSGTQGYYSSSNAALIEMIQNGVQADQAGALDSQGDFTVTYGTPPPPAPKVTVPDVIGRTDLATAESVITSAGLTVKATGDSAAGSHGKVTAESPAAGTSVVKGSTVTLTYTTPPTYAVPNVVGQALSKAQPELTKAGFKSTYTTSGKVVAGAVRVVISESPKAGTKEVKGSTVKLVVRDK